MTQHYLRLFSDVPEDQKPPGVHPAWPATLFSVADGAPAPEEGLAGPFNSEEYAQYLADERPAFDAANAANEAAQTVWRDAAELPGARGTRFVQIDIRTNELIAAGFVYGGKQFSLSIPAQVKLLGMFSARDTLAYPIVWNTLDDLDTLDVVNATEVLAMYEAAVDALRTAVDSGTAVKDQVRDASTMVALNAVVDGR